MLQKFAPLVKRQLEYWQRQIDQYGPGHPRYRQAKTERYRQLVADFTELLRFLNEAEGTDLQVEARFSPEISQPSKGGSPPRYRPRTPAPEPVTAAPIVAAFPDEFSDLPPELLEQLSEGAKAQVDPVIKVINDRGGTATLDQILVDLYRATKEIPKRTMVQNKLFRLSKRELCWSVPGKKGVYTTVRVVEPAQTTNETSPEKEDDKGSNAETSEPSSGKSETKATLSPSSSVSSKARRDLFASTAIPPYRNPR
jgi:hypothetical protein